MPKIINHEDRKKIIVNAAMNMLSENDSLANITMVSIASSCNLSRTTLYQYFHDKEEIYTYAIKKITNAMFIRFSEIAMTNKPLDALDKITKSVISEASDYSIEILTLLSIMTEAKKSGKSFAKNIYHRTRKFSILIKRLLTQAVKAKQLKENTPIELLSEQIIFLLQSACFHTSYFDGEKSDCAMQLINQHISLYK